ncbi:MAG: SpoIVB peptidase [Oscillospiraceae bacterium]|nr:SpoIVB peptidase [Oscillospiraceae bacterium]
MRKLIKRVALFLFASCALVFSLIAYGSYALPEEIAVAGRQPLVLNTPFTAELTADSSPPGLLGASRNALSSSEEGSALLRAEYKVLRLFPVKNAKVHFTKRSYVTVGGDIFGIKLYTKGVLVAKTDLVTTENGNENPAERAGLRCGDLIVAINGTQVNRKRDVSEAIERCGGTPLHLNIQRGGEALTLDLTPVKGASDEMYKAGLWIRDSSAGIGTATFYDQESMTFAGLGHAICDVDSGEIIPISGGEVVSAKVMGCYKGTGGSPGELCGVFESQSLALLEANGETGVYGALSAAPEGDVLPVALKTEVKTGKAQVLATIDGNGSQYYDVEIEKITTNLNSTQRNMTIKITDSRLIEATGGIVQGMSGSPLVQNGMLIGAVTHVFVNTPLEGYAIFAETMLDTARLVAANRSPDA